jgi:hypothetical protein
MKVTIMTLIKSNPQTVNVFDGNQLQVFININDGRLYLKDYNGRVELLSDYLTADGYILENVGNGIEIYKGNTNIPAQIRTLVAGNNIDITQVGDEIHIAVTGLPTIGNVGTGAEIYKSGTDNPFELRSIKQGSNVVVTQNADEIEISSSGVSSLENIGIGAEIYVDASGNNPAQLRTISQGANVVVTQNANEIEIAVPSVVGITLYYGSFYSTQSQTTIGNEQKAMTFNNTDATATSGFSIVSNSRITAAHTGIYNMAFSAQLKKTSGGGATQIYIWIKKNGSNLPDSNTVLTLANNGDLVVAAWNLFLQLNAGQYVELFWYATAATIELHYNATPVVGLPEIPSVIATINRIG